MKNILLLLTVILFQSSCNKKHIPKNIPNCIATKIKKNNNIESVWKYTYQNQEVYLIHNKELKNVADGSFSTLYDSNCSIICIPFGDISGGGDLKCTDFVEKRTNEQLIWKK